MAMILYVMAIRDRSADVYGRPFFATSIGGASRDFADAVNNAAADNVMNRHPEDFDLYELGSYNDATGMFETFPPRMVSIGKDQVTKPK